MTLFLTLTFTSRASRLCAQDSEVMIRVPYRDRAYLGKPLAWDGQELMLLRRDGRISILPVTSANDYETVSSSFRPRPADEIRRSLQQEYGSKYQVSVTNNFVVVHPPGDFSVWAEPFEQLFYRFNAYFSTRGLTLHDPEFPMVAVVLRTRREFDKFLEAYHSYDSKILGYYSPKSNRIITYDQRAGAAADQSWLFNADTIIHEATHQTAFNTGIHSRFATVPRWISEGLAMLFEAPGVNNSLQYTRLSDRVNQNRLRELKSYLQQNLVAGRVSELVASDQLFNTDPSLAYALSWGLTFYLSERRPQEYLGFLAADGQRKNFLPFSGADRSQAFANAFGHDFAALESRLEQFIHELD